jgi:2-keto-4-pentenoate hydratase/2-oxohepta-3-ene-1,7-dioic acid hydratase in catechol pathway
LIFTGTPEGVGPVVKGDELNLFIGEMRMHSFNIK